MLRELKLNRDAYISGEDLSKRLGVSRTAVWKYMKELKKEGYEIEASPKKGYRLTAVTDSLNAHEIRYGLKTEILGQEVVYLDTVDSTSSYAKKLGFEGCGEGTVVVADAQTQGRGRLDKAWSTAPGKGIWMSVVLKPRLAPEEAQMIAIGAAVAVVRAIRNTTGILAGIKWPNDIILDGKKVCGILTEMNSEMDRINFLVLGIGINVNQHAGDFPEELANTAISLQMHGDREYRRGEIIQNLLYELESIYSKINKGFISEIIDEWKEFSTTLGKEVRVLFRNAEYSGTAQGITPEGRLVIACEDGVIREVNSGEVSVRGLLGYT